MATPSLDPTRLESLLESAQLLNSSLDLDSLLSHLLRTVMGRLLVGRGFIAVEDEGTLRLAQIRGLKGLKVGDVYAEEAARAAGVHLIYSIGKDEHPIGLLGVGSPPTGRLAPEEEASLQALLDWPPAASLTRRLTAKHAASITNSTRKFRNYAPSLTSCGG
jgi:phosphoserine phosphatase RsbU/P